AVYRNTSKKPCSLGSVKPNIGHPLCAEGIAGFIKVVLTLHHQRYVPFISGQQPMEHYNIETSPFHFVRKEKTDPTEYTAAGLSSFADGGTNVHVLIQAWEKPVTEYTPRKPLPPPNLKPQNLSKEKMKENNNTPKISSLSDIRSQNETIFIGEQEIVSVWTKTIIES
ncbi:hypothetical protein Q4Q40_23910, partial [Flavivirga jejuensis]|nr:hypothetical protein [Flavivirga jejuensis]